MIIKTKHRVLCKNYVATSKVKFTVRSYSLCIGLCPSYSFVVAPASDMVRYRDPVFHPFVRPIKALSYSSTRRGNQCLMDTFFLLSIFHFQIQDPRRRVILDPRATNRINLVEVH